MFNFLNLELHLVILSKATEMRVTLQPDEEVTLELIRPQETPGVTEAADPASVSSRTCAVGYHLRSSSS